MASELSVLVPRLGHHCSPDDSVQGVKRREESVGGMRASQRLCVGCRLWGGVQPLVQWKRQCRGVGSVTRLCTERGGGSKGVYTEGIRGHYCRFFRASTSLSRQRENTEPLTVCHCDEPFHSAHLQPIFTPSPHAWSGGRPTIPFHCPDRCPSLQRS